MQGALRGVAMILDDRAADAAMERYADGDGDAFAVVYDVLAPQLVRFIRKYGGRADDLVQQTFFQIHLSRGTFVRGAPVKPWAFAIARRLLIDRIRRERHEVATCATLPETWARGEVERPDEAVAARETAEEIARLLAQIPLSQRGALELVRGQGMSMREAASQLGTTVAGVKLRASRALRALRGVLNRSERQGT
jgi:RNA polymerase sigma-70 factor (ECF subfamily)